MPPHPGKVLNVSCAIHRALDIAGRANKFTNDPAYMLLVLRPRCTTRDLAVTVSLGSSALQTDMCRLWSLAWDCWHRHAPLTRMMEL